jgi:hypothetical protein
MNKTVAGYPGQEIHVVLDNLSTHKPKCDRWLARHPNVHFHFTPTHASWLNQVEIWFAILSQKTLAGASFASPGQLREAIDAFIARHNDDAKPFVWTKAVVHQKHFTTRVTHPGFRVLNRLLVERTAPAVCPASPTKLSSKAET